MTRGLLLALALAGCGSGSRVEFQREDMSVASFDVQVARTESERATGLMGQPPLSPGEGLLLVFPGPSEVCLTNAGVDFAIDALFIGEDERVGSVLVGIAANDPTPRCGRALMVLEVAAEAVAGASSVVTVAAVMAVAKKAAGKTAV